MTLDLRPLMTKDSRQQLWLAEVAGLLHDWQKAIDMAVASHWQNNPSLKVKAQEWQQRGQTVKPGQLSAILSQVTWGDPLGTYGSIDLKTLCEEGKDPSTARRHNDRRVQLLGAVHDVAHVDKELSEHEFKDAACDWISSPFGHEFLQPRELFKPLLASIMACDLDSVASRHKVRESLQSALREAWADTRRPINEVTLWDWGSASAALYKAAVAQAILEQGWKEPGTQRWYFLRVGVDRLAFAERAYRIPDLLGRLRVVEEALDEVRKLLEEACPLGSEVYRDEKGSVFIVPALQDDLLVGTLEDTRTLQESIEAIFSQKTAGELLPYLFLKAPQSTDGRLPNLADALRERVTLHRRDIGRLKAAWPEDLEAEKCVVCGLRPQAGGSGSSSSNRQEAARRRHLCIPCLERSVGRVGDWIKESTQDQHQPTIWIDEVSDDNGRCALLVGRFVLDHWLDGEMVKTLALGKDQQGNLLPKNLSFARIRRVWETTKQFWERAGEDVAQAAGTAPRWELVLNGPAPGGLLANHLYELDDGQPFPVVWDGSALLTAENLEYAARSRGIRNADWQGQLRQRLANRLTLYEPGSYGGRRRRVADLSIAKAEDHSVLMQVIPILEEPSLFMAIVPANAALEVLKSIEQHYTVEMGKVRSRLPLHIGLVFFPRKTPVMAVMDAGRRFLDIPSEPEEWTIQSSKDGHIAFENGVTWNIPLKMGDGGTDDQFYPYFVLPAVEGSANQPLPWQQKLALGGSERQYLLRHARDVQQGMRVLVWPSRFDFQWLGSTTERFQMAYVDAVERPGQRPYYLEQLEGRLDSLWQVLAGPDGLTFSQIRQVFEVVEDKRLGWHQANTNDEVLVRLARDLWRTAQWRKLPSSDEIDKLARASADGTLADVVELYMGILKKRPQRDSLPTSADAVGDRVPGGAT